MGRFLRIIEGMRGIFLALGVAASAWGAPTFHKDVLPVLQKNCQGCHRPGEAAPMSFLTYQQTRPWAKAIKEAVASKKMPPWFADPHTGKWANDRRLAQAEIDTLTAWADSGAKEGNPKHAPKPVAWVEGWSIGKPDLVVEMPAEFEVAAAGTVDYQYIVLPMGLTEDKWVNMAEARPGNRGVVHHIIAYVRAPGSKWMADAKPGVPFVPKKGQGMGQGEFLAGYAPGSPALQLRPGYAKQVKAGSDIVLQMHYTANGKPGKDRSAIGVRFTNEPVTHRVVTGAVATTKFAIPPGASDHEVKASLTLQADSEFINLLPHMHLRGKSFEYRVTYPTGETEVALRVPRYDFNWQLWYEYDKPKLMPKGTRIDITGVFDNSANNKFNPDPTKEVKWGEQSWEEMCMGFFDAAIDVKMNPVDLFREKKQPARTGD